MTFDRWSVLFFLHCFIAPVFRFLCTMMPLRESLVSNILVLVDSKRGFEPGLEPKTFVVENISVLSGRLVSILHTPISIFGSFWRKKPTIAVAFLKDRRMIAFHRLSLGFYTLPYLFKVHQFGGPGRIFEKFEVWHVRRSRYQKISREDSQRRTTPPTERPKTDRRKTSETSFQDTCSDKNQENVPKRRFYNIFNQ